MSIGSNAHKNLKRAVALAIGQLPYARAFLRETGQGRVGGRRTPARTLAGGEVVDAYVGEQPMKFGVVGGADVEAFVAPFGRHVELEIKTGTGAQSEDQRMFAAAVQPFGVSYVVVRSVDEALEAVRSIHERDTALAVAAGAK